MSPILLPFLSDFSSSADFLIWIIVIFSFAFSAGSSDNFGLYTIFCSIFFLVHISCSKVHATFRDLYITKCVCCCIGAHRRFFSSRKKITLTAHRNIPCSPRRNMHLRDCLGLSIWAGYANGTEVFCGNDFSSFNAFDNVW
jgi:hypothetical protein